MGIRHKDIKHGDGAVPQREKTGNASALSRLNPYSVYKDSGIEWLEEIPAHWEVKKVNRICLVQRGASPRPIDDPVYFDDDGEYAWVRIADVSKSQKYLENTSQRLSALGKSRSVPLEPGELFLSIAATVGKPIITKIKCCIHDGFVYFVGLRENREYLFYVFSCGELYRGLGKLGTQLNLNTEIIGDIFLAVPPLPEQRAIAAFLDRETAQIDALVAKKERLIELLQEKRTALISHAVTKGLDPDAPLKDSGVEWLGEIPAHWEVKRLKHTVNKIGSGKTPSGGAERYVTNGIMLLRSQNIHFRGLELSDVAYIDKATDDEMSNSRVYEDDVLLNITGASLGRCCVASLKGLKANVNQHVCIIRPNQRQNDPVFLSYSMESQSLQDQIFNNENGVSREALNFEQIGSLVLAEPTIAEQRTIVAFLDRDTAQIDALIAKVQEAIDRLKELRTALISAAVTGKIDVREAAV